MHYSGYTTDKIGFCEHVAGNQITWATEMAHPCKSLAARNFDSDGAYR